MTSNNLIIKNTFILFFRMLVVLGIGLYATRILLINLGFENYGIFILAGSLIALSSFITGTLISVTTRFISISIAKESLEKTKLIFSLVFTIHVILSIFLFILLFSSKNIIATCMEIDNKNIELFINVYLLAGSIFILDIIRSPFNAILIAKENIKLYSKLEISISFFRMIGAILIGYVYLNPLIFYTIYLLAISILFNVLIILYCVKNVPECLIKLSITKEIKEIVNFSAWDLYGNFCSLMRFQGITVLINNFFNVFAIAALGVCNQIQAVGNMVINNLMTAIKPQIFKSYTKKDYERFINLIYISIQFSTLLILMVIIPFFLETDYILKFWLGEYPKYTDEISKYILLFILFSCVSVSLVAALHAIGKVKLPSLINGSLYLLVPILTYFSYKGGSDIYIPFILNIILVILGGFFNALYLKHYMKKLFSISKCYFNKFIPLVLYGFIVYYILIFVRDSMIPSLLRLIILTLISELTLLLYCYFYILDVKIKERIKSKLRLM